MLFEDFCRVEYEAVYRACFALLGNRDAALDATQEAFSRAFARWPRLRRHKWAGGWVMTTALNLCRRELRRSNVEALIAPSEPLRGIEASTANRIDLRVQLRRLPIRQQQAILLRYFGDYPVNVIAQLMDISEGAVKSHLFRARRAFRGQLHSHELEAEDA